MCSLTNERVISNINNVENRERVTSPKKRKKFSNTKTDLNTNEQQGEKTKIQEKRYRVEIVKPRRILSMFVYLNDVEMGGETVFPKLKLCIKPQSGKALLWCNVFPENTNIGDSRLMHKAKTVLGENDVFKIGMNIWVTDSNFTKAMG